MDARAAAEILRSSLKDPEKPITIADAAAASGLALRDAERGLQWLTHEYRGHLRVTEDGDLLFLFPTRFTKPWEAKEGLLRALAGAGRVVVGVGRFVVRAWLMIVLVAYAAIFLAILVGSMFASRSNNSSSSRNGGAVAYVLFRALADAMFWTFHPFSPLAIDAGGYGWAGGASRVRRRGRQDETPFYEKVNRFFFGPTEAPPDPRENEQKILAQMRAQKGRIGLADVMRVTGLPREEADPMMARLMLDYDGDVEVSESGGIFYRFPAIRRTAQTAPAAAPRPAWSKAKALLPLTGNDGGSNAIIVALNAFNALMAWFAIGANLTVDKVIAMFSGIPLEKLPYDGVPVALGVVPLVFSLALFLLPLARAALRPLRARKIARENARLAVLREVLTRVEEKGAVTDEALARAWKTATGAAPSSAELTREVVRLGGDVDLDAADARGTVRYRFADLEAEQAALEAEREAAADDEAKVGKVVFGSDR